MLMNASNRSGVKVPMYEGNLNVAELMDSINSLYKYFEFEEIEDKKNVRYEATRLKGHASTQKEEVSPKSNIFPST